MKIGHLRFRVREIEPAVAFYTGRLLMTVNERVGDEYAFLGCSDAHHEIALMKAGGTDPSPARGSLGFDHLAFELPDRKSFAEAFFRLSQSGVKVEPVDTGISWAMYFADPDGNRIEMFTDTRTAPGGRPRWEGRSEELAVEVIQAALQA
jgi:catechol 2,3-dioxygenase